MNFKNGYLGACIVVLGVVATIIAGYALSIDVTDEEVTKYKYTADLNGLFDSEQAPAYIEYNPSTNFTGYYTDDSIIGAVKYFDGVKYKDTTTNQYRLNIMPGNRTTGTLTLSGDNWTNNPTIQLYATANNDKGWSAWNDGADGKSVLLKDIIGSMTLADGVDFITLRSNSGLNALTEPVDPSDDIEPDWVLFSSKNTWSNRFAYFGTADYITGNYSGGPTSYGFTINPVMLSCTIDLTTNLVTFYYDNNLQRSGNTYNLDDVVVSYSGGNGGNLILGETVQYEAYTKPDPTYMDIREGVWMGA